MVAYRHQSSSGVNMEHTLIVLLLALTSSALSTVVGSKKSNGKRGAAGLGYGGWPSAADLPASDPWVPVVPGYPGVLPNPEITLAKTSADSIALQKAQALQSAEVAAAIAAAKEASAAAAIANQQVQQAKQAVLIQQKIASAKEAAAAAAVQRSEAAIATAAAIQRSEAAAEAAHRQAAAVAAEEARRRSDAAAQAAAAIKKNQLAAHLQQKSSAQAAPASQNFVHPGSSPYPKPVEYPWG